MWTVWRRLHWSGCLRCPYPWVQAPEGRLKKKKLLKFTVQSVMAELVSANDNVSHFQVLHEASLGLGLNIISFDWVPVSLSPLVNLGKVVKLHTKLGKPIPSTEPVLVNSTPVVTTSTAGKPAVSTAPSHSVSTASAASAASKVAVNTLSKSAPPAKKLTPAPPKTAVTCKFIKFMAQFTYSSVRSVHYSTRLLTSGMKSCREPDPSGLIPC